MVDDIVIKNAEESDLGSAVRLENEIWPEGTRATREKFEFRLKIFPQGFFIAYKDRKIIGVSTSEIIIYNLKEPPKSWGSITDNGYIKQTHNPSGNALYVVSVGARSRSGGGSALIQAQKNLAERFNLRYLILGARLPGYNSYFEDCRIPVEEYVKLRRENGELLDPELRFYTRNGLEMHKIMPQYMEDDRESRNYGVIMVWLNN